ncbi:MAG: DUF1156 domain-containing protein, partial [Nitrososphaerota archaeon]|nr:DUF1156 domain-containing protein [Nitrososphaerota archaeon]
AVLLAMLLADPCDPKCPEEFKIEARRLLSKTVVEIGASDEDLREAILRFIARFSAWEQGNDPSYIKCARKLVRAAHEGGAPLVVDPFAGGGSIPLEAIRVGCDTFASDLNPVACLLEKVLLEDLPRDGPKLARELRAIGEEVQRKISKELSELYPPDEDGRTPIAYLWARTVRCESPNCGVEIPLTRSLWLSRRRGHKVALRPVVTTLSGASRLASFELFVPAQDEEVPEGTVSRAKARCLGCGATLPPERVRAQLRDQRGGTNPVLNAEGHRIGGATLLAVVTTRKGESGRRFRQPSDHDYQVLSKTRHLLDRLSQGHLQSGDSLVPNEPTPTGGGTGAGRAFALHQYGVTLWSDLFTARQQIALLTLQRCALDAVHGKTHRPALVELLAVASDRVVMSNVSLTNWNAFAEKMQHGFGLQVLRIVWDFAEVVPIVDAPGNWRSGFELVANAAEQSPSLDSTCQVQLADACHHPLPDQSAAVWFTDPPYYDAVPYSDLSDFFYVWLKRMLHGHSLLRDPFDPSNQLTPKRQEIVQDETRMVNGHPKDSRYFEFAMDKAFAEGRRILKEDGIGCVVFAHKTTEGWEALLSGLVRNGWVVTGSWPLVTEMGTRLRARDSAALATSIHLVCRPRPTGAPVGEWAEVARELPRRVRAWMQRLGREGISGADLVFACIGPAMEVYSKYSRVVDAQDREIPLGGHADGPEPYQQGFLAKVWEVVGRLALEEILGQTRGGVSSLEDDARLTALFLWTLQGSTIHTENPKVDSVGSDVESEGEQIPANSGKSDGGLTLVYDIVRRFAQPLGIHLDEWEGKVVETNKGVVRLLSVSERASQLFSQNEVEKLHSRWEDPANRVGRQLTLLPDQYAPGRQKEGARPKTTGKPYPSSEGEAGPWRRTTLDRLHMAMLLQANGASAPLRSLLQEEKKRGPEFERLVSSLSALYPKESEERRLVEAIALVIRR